MKLSWFARTFACQIVLIRCVQRISIQSLWYLCRIYKKYVFLKFQLIQDIYDFHDAWTKGINPSKETKKFDDQTETSESSIPLDKVKIISEAETQDKTQPGSSEIENNISDACISNTKRVTNSDNGDNHPDIDQPIKRLKSDNEPSTYKVISPSVESSSDCALSDSRTQDLPGFDPTKCSYDEDCEECHKEYIDPKPSELVMYLHSWKNKVVHTIWLPPLHDLRKVKLR